MQSRIRERIRKLSSSFHNLAAGLRRKPKNYASDDHIAQSIQTLVKQSSEQRGDRDKSRPSTAGSSTGHRSLGRRRSPLSGGASSSDSLDKVQSASRSVALDSPRLCADPGEIPQVILSQQPEWFRWGIAGRPGQAAAFGTAAGTPPFDSTIPHPQPVHAHHEDQDPNSSTDDIYITSAEATDDENDDTGAQAERERLRQFARAYGEDLDGGREDESSDGGGLEMSGTGVIIIDDRENEE
ncbi:hypothetical protein DFS34DRAFT_33526 [Phlyctochytrium arcticum]|nr:hypothetical protein DFS34DRAFT_33526 [Phlyctochytrium arcticum]